MFSAVGKRTAHNFGQRMDIICGVIAHLLQVVALEHIEHLNQRNATTTWRWHGDDAITTISSFNGCTLNCLVFFKVFVSNQTTALLHKSNKFVGSLTFIKSIATLVSDAFECFCQVALSPHFAGLVVTPVFLIHYFRGGWNSLPFFPQSL